MKIALLPLMVVFTMTAALANEEAIQMRKRLIELELERQDYRKPKQELPKDKEIERQAVIGWLYVNDGLWRLKEEVVFQINALAGSTINDDKRNLEIDKRKKALAIIADLMSRPETILTDIEVGELRALITIGDRIGLEAWRESKERR